MESICTPYVDIETPLSDMDTSGAVAATPTKTAETLSIDDSSSPRTTTSSSEPLYTEINIPLPPLPSETPTTPPPSSPDTTKPGNNRAPHTLHSFSPFHRRHRRRSSSDSGTSSASGSPVQERNAHMAERRIELSMSAVSKGRKAGMGVDAAIAPAMMVLRAELFTPGAEERARKVLEGRGGLDVRGG